MPHRTKHRAFSAALAVMAGIAAPAVQAEVRIPSLFTHHMVLQRQAPIAVWGWADPGEAITVTIGGAAANAVASIDGMWRMELPAMEAGGPHTLLITGENTITINDVMLGEVWICSGQSNMEWSVARSNNAEAEVAAADHTGIRLFTVPNKIADEPQSECGGTWRVCSPNEVNSFSAVGYFFGRELHRALDVPIGLIDSTWGGTPVEAWTARSELESAGVFGPLLERWDAQPEKQSPHRPASLYNGMIHPLAPYGLRGAIWYQGESNASRAQQYRALFPAMIRNWRSVWRQEDQSFYFVQLANFKQRQDEPGPSDWAELREAQTLTLGLPHTGMAVIIDIGEAKDIHPRNKQDVGKRLALWALAKNYGRSVVHSGPIYKSMKKQGKQIILNFNHVGGGFWAKGRDSLAGFAIAGEDRKFVWANARMRGNRIIVSHPDVPDPVAVRYGWADNPDCNLFNREGLPASPFRTDDWPGVTDGRQ